MKTLIACLTSKDHAAEVLAAAIPLANRHGSHLIALHAMETLAIYPGVMAHVPEDVVISFAESRREEANAIHAIFEQETRNADFPTEWRCVDTGSTSAGQVMIEISRTADLIIMARATQGEGEGDADRAWFREEMIRQSGRPVLLVPEKMPDRAIGRSAVIGWSPTREATRAAHDALPLLSEGARVSLVTVGEEDTREAHGVTELARALDRHGLEVEVVARMLGRDTIASVLMREAHERGADLIVTGAFGHSRLYDFVIGAVTRELLEKSDTPVLFSR